MENVINVLDYQVANLIAAGEVVERPASAIKELVENSIDSGASHITVEIKNGGISLMRVTDNGCGMSREDAALSIKRHATSKIKDASDLNYIVTLGFRGEALAAISSVSKMRIFTKRREDETGTMLESDSGRVVTIDDVGCADGTTIMIEELFANVPARRKFLKRDAAETMAVTTAVEKAALGHSELSFKLICDGKIRFQTAGDGNLKNTVYATMGRECATKLIAVRGESDGVEVNGYIGTPEQVKKNRHSENFFINGRYIRSMTASSAAEAAFQTYIPSDKFPVCILHLKIHPSLVDVNVHPSKLEVKFSNERVVFDAVYSAVRGALVHNISRPRFETKPEEETKERKGEKLAAAFVPQPDRTQPVRSINSSILDIEYEEPKKNSAQPANTSRTDEGYVYRDDDVPAESKDKFPKGDSRVSESISIGGDSGLSRVIRGVSDTPVMSFGINDRADGGAAKVSPSPEHETEHRGISDADRFSLREGDEHNQPELKGKISSEYYAQGAELDETSGQTTSESNPFVFSGSNNAETNGHNSQNGENPEREKADYTIIGVASNAYVFVELEDCILVIDKHAAHERILFERMKENMYGGDRCPQVLLIPEKIKLSGEEYSAAIEYRDEILRTGFSYELGEEDASATVTQIPSEITHSAVSDMFSEILSRLCDGGEGAVLSRDTMYEKALFQASCKAAVKAGYHDDISNIKWIVSEVINNPRIRYCPHGRPVSLEMTKHDIEHRFKRI